MAVLPMQLGLLWRSLWLLHLYNQTCHWVALEFFIELVILLIQLTYQYSYSANAVESAEVGHSNININIVTSYISIVVVSMRLFY